MKLQRSSCCTHKFIGGWTFRSNLFRHLLHVLMLPVRKQRWNSYEGVLAGYVYGTTYIHRGWLHSYVHTAGLEANSGLSKVCTLYTRFTIVHHGSLASMLTFISCKGVHWPFQWCLNYKVMFCLFHYNACLLFRQLYHFLTTVPLSRKFTIECERLVSLVNVHASILRVRVRDTRVLNLALTQLNSRV